MSTKWVEYYEFNNGMVEKVFENVIDYESFDKPDKQSLDKKDVEQEE